MEPSVEAQSLSSLTTIAANPPLDFNERSLRSLEPLVLYIARVPGRRDVFLSPLKPRKRVVTAEDIQSCFYYFHVNHANDDLLLDLEETACVENEGDVGVNPLIAKAHQRKPIGSQKKANLTNLSGHQYSRDDDRDATVPRRKPVGSHSATQQKQTSRSFEADYSPLSPRSATYMNTLSLSSTRVSHPHLYQGENSHPNRRDSMSHNFPKTDEQYRSYGSNDGKQSGDYDVYQKDSLLSQSFGGDADMFVKYKQNGANENQRGASQTYSNSNESNKDVNITIIRRDPSSGTQWNVGSIIDPPSMDVSSEALQSYGRVGGKRRSDSPFFVELHTAGYSRFISQERLQSQLYEPSRSDVEKNEIRRTSSPHLRSLNISPEGSFRRRLWAEPSRLGRADKVRKGLKRKNFVFNSPWNGRCELSTGLDGDSLKCRHGFLNSNSSNSPTSPIDDSAVLVSELRFNLPMTKAAKRSTTDNYSNLLENHRLNHVSTHRKFNSLSSIGTSGTFGSLSSSSNNDSIGHWNSAKLAPRHSRQLEDEGYYNDENQRHQRHRSMHTPSLYPTRHERLDLSLAEEHAGGGFAGRQAKLGKLIVYGDGLKMLDLLVAANMGLWWRAYERVEGAGG